MNKDNVVKWLEKTIFAVRWLLIPLYAGLVGALGLYIIHFLHEVYEMFLNWFHNAADQNVLMLFILEMVDMVMISQLVVMTIQGGYSIFVKEFDFELLSQRPRWLTNGLGSSEQKIKMGMSVIGILIVNLTKVVVGDKVPLSWDDLAKKVVIMTMVIIATWAFCKYNLLMHDPILLHTDHTEDKSKGHH